jgi:hypothetical protein
MAVSIRNTSAAQDPPVPPTKADGRPYLYEMIYAGGARRAYADDTADLMDMLTPGYTSLTTTDERAEARLRLALDIQVRLQAELATGGALAECTEDQRATILGSRHTPPNPATWTAPVPLVLITSFYRPAGRLTRPQGPPELQIWLDPDDDWKLVTSLHATGTITVGRRSTGTA